MDCCGNISKILLKILNSQGLNNTIIFVSAWVALITYKNNVKHKKLQTTLDIVSTFLDGNWISQKDKENWNEFYTNRLCRTACRDEFNGKYKAYFKEFDEMGGTIPVECDINELFMENPEEYFARSISQIMQVLEFIAKKVNGENLDEEIVRIRLLRFYWLANYYNRFLSVNTYPEITELYNKFSKSLRNNYQIGEYCTFNI